MSWPEGLVIHLNDNISVTPFRKYGYNKHTHCLGYDTKAGHVECDEKVSQARHSGRRALRCHRCANRQRAFEEHNMGAIK